MVQQYSFGGPGIDVYEATKAFLNSGGGQISIGRRKLEIEVDSDKVELDYEAKNFISNQLLVEVNKFASYPPSFDERRTNLRAGGVYARKKPLKIIRGKVYAVDFGPRYGAEFSYIHWALVSRRTSDGTYLVYPMTSKYHKGKGVYEIVISTENFVSKSDEVFQNTNVSYILFHLGQPVDKSRFLYEIGSFKEPMLQEFRKVILEDAGEAFANNPTERSMEIYTLSSLQSKMINDCKNDAERGGFVSVIKGVGYDYETRLQVILKYYGFDMSGVGVYLGDFIRECKDSCKFDVDEVVNKISKGRILTPQLIKNNILEAVDNRFNYEGISPMAKFTAFVRLVNKLAANRV